MKQWIAALADRVIAGGGITGDEGQRLIGASGSDAYALFLGATRIREHFLGNDVHLCAIINAKSGRCPENCAFCAQSAHFETATPVYPLVDEERIVAEALVAQESGSSCYGIVTSGSTVCGEELERICEALRRIRQETAIAPACSLGIIDAATAAALKEAGMVTYHHNLETARSFFPNICTTHAYDDDITTVSAVKGAGLRVCSGGILGLGETPAQRVELAFTLRELAVDSIPLNFLNPIPGTPLENADHITPLECLNAIALFRFVNPDREISVCGGREKNLRDLQSWIFFAGASGTMTGNYLTTTGRAAEEDWQMLKDLGLTVAACCGETA
jgi:biotin synthase